MMVSLDLSGLSVVFISYDEPNADDNYHRLIAQAPAALRVHGVRGFDAAHRAAGAVASTAHVITIDGDNRLLEPDFLSRRLRFSAHDLSAVISFSAHLGHNGLTYGNGGVKIWPRPLLRTLRSNEAGGGRGLGVDFAWRIPYVQAHGCPSESIVTASPFQAFRAGFREGVRLCIDRGRLATARYRDLPPGEALQSHLPPQVIERLKVWCSVGRDTENGEYAILGARRGCVMAMLDGFDAGKIADFDWIAGFWQDEVAPGIARDGGPDGEIARLGDRLAEALGLVIDDLDPTASAFVKSLQRPSRRLGTLTPVTGRA